MSVIDDIFLICNKLDIADANEAETRLKVIDKILFEVLNWTHEDVNIEQRVSEDGETTFCDYIIKTASTAFVVEAKKIGLTFSIENSGRRIKLSKTNLHGKFGDTVIQARDYCRKLGIQFAVVTNGKQWAVFPAIRTDQIAFASSYAIAFNSLASALRDDYSEFYDLLSRQAVVNSSLENNLLGSNEDQVEERRLKNHFRSPATSNSKNPIYPLIEQAIALAFSDSITEVDKDLFAKCYVNTPDRTKFDRRISMHISKSQHLFRSQPKRPLNKRDSSALKNALENAKASARQQAIIVIGTVGSGKTTFLHYTRNISAADIFSRRPDNSNPHWIRVDFLAFSKDIPPIDYIYQKIKNYIIEDAYLGDYRKTISLAYENEIKSLKRGPLFLISEDSDELNKAVAKMMQSDYEKTKPYVENIISHVASLVPIFLVIDNVDQLDEETQTSIFTDTVALAKKLGVNLVIALRGSTYVQHRNSPAFNAFDFDPLLIEPPKVESVLSKRFFLAKNLIAGTGGEFIAENGARVIVDDLGSIIDLVQSSVLGTEIGSLLEVLAAEDIRNALRMTREFLEHGYSNPGRAIRKFQSTGSYILPKHEAFRSILLGNQAVYSEAFSLIGNPYDSRQGRTNLQLLRLFVLSALVQHSSNPQFQYLEGTEIRKWMLEIGVPEENLLNVLKDITKQRFIHTASHDAASFNSSYFPSRLGGHIVRELVGNFTFIENVMMDTFIGDTETWETLVKHEKEIYSERNIVKRVKLRTIKVKDFSDYVERLYASLLEEAQKRSLPKEWCSNPLREAKHLLDKHCVLAIESAKRNYRNTPNK